MFKKIIVFIFTVCMFGAVNSLDIKPGTVHNITWNSCMGCDMVGINLENKLNGKWVNSKIHDTNYLSIIKDSEPPFYLWRIPTIVGTNEHRFNIINLDTGENIGVDEFKFFLNTTTSTTITPTTSSLLEHTKNDKGKLCFNSISCYPVITVLIFALLLVLCVVCKCCC